MAVFLKNSKIMIGETIILIFQTNFFQMLIKKAEMQMVSSIYLIAIISQ